MTRLQVLDAARRGLRPQIGTFQTGGGAPGVCMHAGFLRALARVGLYPSHISGTSAGAVAGFVYAATQSADALCDAVRSMPPDACQSPTSPSWLPDWLQIGDALAFDDPINNNDKALALLREHGPAKWSDIPLDLRMWSSQVGHSGCIRHQVGPADFDLPHKGAMASMSVPWLFAAMIALDGTEHYDGGCVFNVPIIPEWIATLDHVFLLVGQTRAADRPEKETPSELDRAIRILRGMLKAQIDAAVDALSIHANCTVIWPDFVDNTGLLTFNPALIDQADAYATSILTSQ